MNTLATVDLGDAVRVVARLRRPTDDALVDGTVTAAAIGPSGETPTVEVTRLSTGLYQARFTPLAAGTWRVTITIAGAYTAIEHGLVRVRPAP